MSGVLGDERAVSEGMGVAALVLLTVLVTASVGMNVLFTGEGESGGIDAEFDFQYFSERSSLLMTYNTGPELDAGNVTIVAPGKNLTWATLRELNATDTISPGSRAQLNAQNAYGFRVAPRANVTIVYTQGENESVLDFYNGGGTSGN
jgi:hypothetical protein